MILGVDVSVWNTDIDWDILYAGGVRFAIVKISQGRYIKDSRARSHTEAARKAGILVGGYHWDDPMQDDKLQANNAISVAKDLDIKFISVDVEQYWQYWSEFYANAVVNFIQPERIKTSAWNIYYHIKQAELNSLIYTRGTFVQAYSPQMFTWLRIFMNWYASYPYKKGRVNISWADIMNTTTWYPKGTPVLPQGVPYCLWQFSGDKFILPGTGRSPIDLNFYTESQEELEALFGGKAIIPTPPTPGNEVEMKLMTQRIVTARATPNALGTTIRMRPAGEVIIVQEIRVLNSSSVWVKDQVGWSAVVHGGVVYMKETT